MEDIEKLIEGFKSFKANYFSGTKQLFDPHKKGQKPLTAVIGCCDSRVDPAILFCCDPGELFVIRNVANLVPPYEENGGYHGVSAALQFAVMTLGVKHIIVLGHANCGGISALMSGTFGTGQGGFIEKWMTIAHEARELAMRELTDEDGPEARTRACEQASILVSMSNLMSFPWIGSRVEDGSIHLHGWYFDMESGSLMKYSYFGQDFEVVA